MADETKTIDLIKTINEAVETMDKTIGESKGRLDVLENDVVKKASDAAAKAVESIQAIELKMTAADERQKDLELQLAKKSTGAVDDAINDEYSKALNAYLRKNVTPSDEVIEKAAQILVETKMFAANNDLSVKEVKEMVAGSNPDGGFFITPAKQPGMVKRLFETSPVRSVSNIQSSSSTTFEVILDDDESAAGWVGEIQSRPNTDTAQIGKVIIPLHEIYANPRASQRMLDNAGFNLEMFINDKSIDKISRMENTSFVTGDGSMKPKGFMTYSAWSVAGTYQRDAIEQVTGTDSTATVVADDLIDLQNTLLDPYQAGAVFGMNRSSFADVMKLTDTTGQYLLNREMLLQGASRVLLGSPVVIMSDMADLATSSLSVIYGNFKQGYTIVDGIGFRVLRDPYSAKPYVQFYTTKNVGGACTDFAALKILKSGTLS